MQMYVHETFSFFYTPTLQRTRSTLQQQQGRNEGEGGRNSPGTESLWGSRRVPTITQVLFLYSTFASERRQGRTWGRQTCLVPRMPSNSVTPPGQQSQKCACLAAITRYITISFTIHYLQIFKARYFFSPTYFGETTNYDVIFLRKTYHRHVEARAANFWDLLQSDQPPFDKTLLVLADFLRETLTHKPDK